MADYVYSWNWLRDPHLGAPHAWLFEGEVIGFDQLALDATRTGRFDIAVMTERVRFQQ